MNEISRNKAKRFLWEICRITLFRPFVGRLFMPWRAFILRAFGAKLEHGVHVYASAHIREPWLLTMGKGSCLAPGVICYNVARVSIGNGSTISQRTFLCTASHDIDSPQHTLTTAPIHIGNRVWVAAEAFIGMGVTLGNSCVVGARAAVFRDVAPGSVVGGNPAVLIRKRKLHL